MKRIFILLMLIVIFGFISGNYYKSGLHGLIEPVDGARKVWAISGTDSFSTIPVVGKFAIDLKPGSWTVIVEAVSPLKNAMMDNVLVQENQSTDVGLITLREK